MNKPTEMPPPEQALAEQTAVEQVRADLPCLSCGYNLRTLPVSGACPECGLAVSDTLKRALACADVDWLKTLEEGATALTWSSVFTLVTVFSAWALLLGSRAGAVGIGILGFAALVAFCNGAVGTIGVTKPEPRTPPMRWRSAPGAARACPAAVLSLAIILIAAWASGSSLVVVVILAPLLTGILVLWPTLLAVYVHFLLKRGAAPGVARLARVTAWVGWVSLGLLATGILAAAVLRVFSANAAFKADTVYGVVFSLASGGLLAMIFLVMALMFRLRRALERAIAIAKSSELERDSASSLAEAEQLGERA